VWQLRVRFDVGEDGCDDVPAAAICLVVVFLLLVRLLIIRISIHIRASSPPQLPLRIVCASFHHSLLSFGGIWLWKFSSAGSAAPDLAKDALSLLLGTLPGVFLSEQSHDISFQRHVVVWSRFAVGIISWCRIRCLTAGRRVNIELSWGIEDFWVWMCGKRLVG